MELGATGDAKRRRLSRPPSSRRCRSRVGTLTLLRGILCRSRWIEIGVRLHTTSFRCMNARRSLSAARSSSQMKGAAYGLKPLTTGSLSASITGPNSARDARAGVCRVCGGNRSVPTTEVCPQDTKDLPARDSAARSLNWHQGLSRRSGTVTCARPDCGLPP